MLKIRIWDLPTRLFHWLLVIAFIIAWLTEGDSRWLDFHVFAGYLFFALLIFRLFWGIWGSHYACFHQFAYGWQAVWCYLKTLWTPNRQHFLGHNPAGSWAVFVILALGLAVGITGVATLGGLEQYGPLAGCLNFAQGEMSQQWHEILAWTLLGVVVIHVIGVIVASWLHGENLPRAMVTGEKMAEQGHTSVSLHGVVAIVLVILVMGGGGYYFQGYFTQTEDRPYLPFVGPDLPQNALWNEVCGECHPVYHPSLLPAGSWQRMLAEQAEHFEEDLYLEPETIEKLTAFAIPNAAENPLTKIAWKMYTAIGQSEAPLRITETDYWQHQHHSIAWAVWEQSNVNHQMNCPACHLDAKRATFRPGAMHIPEVPKLSQNLGGQ
jgi:cytochrome b